MTTEVALDTTPFEEVRQFYLVRHEEQPGRPDTGLVAVGTVYPSPNDRVVLAWLTAPAEIEVFDSLDALFERHDREGVTEIVFPTDADDATAGDD